MISVCMATYNGITYLEQQVDSILQELNPDDELIVSDDDSSDGTLELLINLQVRDSRLVILKGPGLGLIKNFENALNNAQGNIIFLADQDDVWLKGKVCIMLAGLDHHDLIVSNCFVTDKDLNCRPELFFDINGFGAGIFKNLYKNKYLGCCMAFKANVLKKALPFPNNIPMHDWWLGLIADLYFNVGFSQVPTLKYRRHGENSSDTSEQSSYSFSNKIKFRCSISISLIANLLTSTIKSTN